MAAGFLPAFLGKAASSEPDDSASSSSSDSVRKACASTSLGAAGGAWPAAAAYMAANGDGFSGAAFGTWGPTISESLDSDSSSSPA